MVFASRPSGVAFCSNMSRSSRNVRCRCSFNFLMQIYGQKKSAPISLMHSKGFSKTIKLFLKLLVFFFIQNKSFGPEIKVLINFSSQNKTLIKVLINFWLPNKTFIKVLAVSLSFNSLNEWVCQQNRTSLYMVSLPSADGQFQVTVVIKWTGYGIARTEVVKLLP